MAFRSSADKEKKVKKSVFAWWHILVFAALLITALALLFPQKLLMQAILENQKPNALAIAYLKNLILLYPKDVELRLSLAQQEMGMGNLEEAAKAIDPLLTPSPHTQAQWKAIWLHYQIVRTQAYALPEKSPERLQKQKELISLLPVLAQSPYLTPDTAAELAQEAVALGDPTMGVLFYEMTANANINKPASYFVNAAKTALFVSDYKRSAKFYFIAMQKSSDLAHKREYFIAALNSLNMGGYPQVALQLSPKYIDGLAHDQEVLVYLAKLALSANNGKEAVNYIKQALQLQYLEEK